MHVEKKDSSTSEGNPVSVKSVSTTSNKTKHAQTEPKVADKPKAAA